MSDYAKLNEGNEEIVLNDISKYPNLFEYQSIPENNNYFIFPIQMTNSTAFPECIDISKIYENLTEEIGLFNIYKEINYDLALQREFSTSKNELDPPIDQKEFYNDLIYLLQGIPNSTFIYSDKYPFTFKLNENCNINNFRLIGTLPGMTRDILQKFIIFGTKMQLLQFLIKKYLFDVEYRSQLKNNSPFFENFFRGINEILIKINGKLIFYKKLITEENFTMLTLYNKVKSLAQIINVIYILFNLKDQRYFTDFKGNNMEQFFNYYNDINNNNNFKRINLFLDMLLKVYFTFYNKDKIFYIIKHILLSSLHSYLYYIVNLLFTGDSTDESGEHFILTSNNRNNANDNNNNISLDAKKLPQFLIDYKRPLLNNTILTKYIKRFDENYYNMLAYNLKDFIEYINNINIRDFSIDTLNNFKAFKEEIYKKKIQLMEEVNKEVIFSQQLKENEINLKNLQKIKEIKNYFIDYEKEEAKRKRMIKEKKEKYYNELKEQILGKKRRIEEEIRKLKNEEIEQKEKERREKEYEKKFIHLMKLKYKEIQEKTRDIQIFGSLINKWIFQRNELNEKRKLLFEQLYGDNYQNNIDQYYPMVEVDIEGNDNVVKNYHKTIQEQMEFIENEIENEVAQEEEEQEKINKNKKQYYNNSDNIKLIFNQIEENKNKNEESELKKENENENKEQNSEEINMNIENNEQKPEQSKIDDESLEKKSEQASIDNENKEQKSEQANIDNEKKEQNPEQINIDNENKENNSEEINTDIENKNKNENPEEIINNNDKNKDKENNNELKEEKNKEIDINEIKLDITNENNNNEEIKENNEENQQINNKENDIEKEQKIEKENKNEKENIEKKKEEKEENMEKKKEEKEEKEENEVLKLNYDNKNKYLQNINLFPEKEIPEDTEALYKLTTLIQSEDEDNNDIINNDIFINRKNKNKQIPIQLIIKEFFHDIILKQNAITNQTFVLMLKNKFGLMHYFDFFNSIILCNKGNLILQYIETIFDFKTLSLNTSDPEFLTNELRSIVRAEYENNVKCLYLNSLLESLKFNRLTDLNLNYAINNLELNFQLAYAAAPPVDVIFNSSNSEYYDKIFKKLLKYNIYNQICVKIYQMLKNIKYDSADKKTMKNIKMKYSDFNDFEYNEEESKNEENNESILNIKLVKLFNKSFKLFKGILTFIYQQIIQKVWMEMEKKIDTSMEVFQIIKYHYEALKNITKFFDNNLLINYFENLCNDLAQLYLQILVSDYYDRQKEKNDFLEEVIEKLKDDNKTIINYRDSLDNMSPYYPLKSYL